MPTPAPSMPARTRSRWRTFDNRPTGLEAEVSPTVPLIGTNVVVLVGADVVVDARVRKSARTLADAGATVTVLFTAKKDHDYPDALGPVHIERVAPPHLHVPRPWSESATNLWAMVASLGGYPSLQGRRRAVHRRKLAERRTAARIVRRKLRLAQLRTRGGTDLTAKLLRRLERETLVTATRVDRSRMRAWRRLQRARIARTDVPVTDEEFPFQAASPLTRADLRRDWRRALPDLAELELVFAPRIDAIRPDVIHAHDYHLLPAAVEAARHARATGRDVAVIYDAHEYVRGLTTLPDERRRALSAMETGFIPHVDAIITVSDGLAERLAADHGCDRPTVVLNAPFRVDTSCPASRDLRTEAGVPEDQPLLVYSGNVTPARGVHTLVDAMAHLPEEIELVLVVGDRVRYLDQLLERAEQQGTAGRLHLAPYVPTDEVPAYLARATIGVHPMRRYPNADLALPNKLFEYVQAGIPVVVSDCDAQGRFVRSQGIGEVFRPDDPVDLARAVRSVLADANRYRSALSNQRRQELSWAGQEPALLKVYETLLRGNADD